MSNPEQPTSASPRAGQSDAEVTDTHEPAHAPRGGFPRDRFDDLPETDRVGAHRAHQPRMRIGLVVAWSAVATVVLIVVGIAAVLVSTDGLSSRQVTTTTATPEPETVPVLDTSYAVTVLNATTEAGLAQGVADDVVAAGWASDSVTAGNAGATDFETTTVYYAGVDDEGAALGLADAIGGASVVQSDAYQPVDDPDTEADESLAQQLTVVVGADRAAASDDTAADG